MDDLDELIARLNESREHCGMCGEQAVVRNSRDQYICEVCLHETIPTPPYRMRWEAADAIEALQARVTELEAAIAKMDWERPTLAQLSAARNDALEDAARMVDCACECREAVLTANTRVERWTACGRDPCGALDAAAIRAMKGERG